MNNLRRKTLQDLYNIIADAKDNLDEVRDEEECYKDNMPENLQNSERYEKAEAAVDALENAICSLEEALDSIEEAKE